MGSLDGRVVVVTGAARAMGREHALLAAGEGAKVVVVDSGVDADGRGGDPALAADVARAIRDAGGTAIATSADVADSAAVRDVLALTLDTFGQVDGLVNNAGILRDKMFVNMADDDWDAVIRGQLRATYAPTRVFAEHWRNRSKAGEQVAASIVNVSSTSGVIGAVGQTNYGAAKAGIAALTVILAQELGRYGVRVNAVVPVARSRMTEDLPGVGEMVAVPADPAAFDIYHPGNVSPLVAWLLSPQATATGEVVYSKGGELRRMSGWTYAATFDAGHRLTVDEVDAAMTQLLEESK